MMRAAHTNRAWAMMLIAAALSAGLAGCSGTFSANVANQSAHPVRVDMVYTAWYGKTKVLASKRLAPGDAAVLGPASAHRSVARLFAQPEGVAAPRASMNIPSGRTTAHVIGAALPRDLSGVEWRLIESNPN